MSITLSQSRATESSNNALGGGVGSLRVSREAVIPRAPATVWKLLGAFDALDVWLPPVRASSSRGQPTQPGAVRVLDLGNGAAVTEELLEHSDADRRYRYAFVSSPLPVRHYVATIELAAAAGNRTLVKWSSTFDADGAPDEEAKQAILGIYDAGLGRLEAIFRG